MTHLLDEINLEINIDEYDEYTDNIILLENKIGDVLDKLEYISSFQKIIRYIHLDLLWSVDIFNKLVIYKIADEIYFKNLINLI